MARSGRHRLTRSRRTAGGRLLLVAAVLLGALAVPAAAAAGITLERGGLAGGLSGSPLAAQRIDIGGAGLAIRRVPEDGQGPHAAAQEQLVASVVADLQTFWAATLPVITGEQFAPLRGGVTAVDSAAPAGSAPCVATPDQINGNAYYCPADDGIVYDSSALVPVLLSRYGAPGLVGAFAHEFGHAVQARIGPTTEQRTADPQRYPSLLVEAQGDCDAGAFLAWVVAGRAPHIHFGAAGMAAAVGPLLDFADPVMVQRTDPAAHGLALDRLTSVLLGYRDGAAACHAMTVASLHPTLGAVPLPPGGAAALATPRYPTTRAVLAAARASLAAFTGRPVAESAPESAPAAAALAAAGAYGQFAQATVLALDVGEHDPDVGGQGTTAAGQGTTAGGQSTAAAGQGTAPGGQGTAPGGQGTAGGAAEGAATAVACFAGAWAASVFGHAPAGALGSWPGDADEGLEAVRIQPGATFADAAGYADGFHGGLTACR